MYERWTVNRPAPELEIICARRDHAPVASITRTGGGWACVNSADAVPTRASYGDLTDALRFVADGLPPIPPGIRRTLRQADGPDDTP